VSRRLPTLLLAVLVAGAAAAAAVALNLVLLNRAAGGNDPVGRLQPRLTGVSTAPRSPVPEIRPTDGVVENQGSDD
jgi:hypothetical protein